MKSTIKLFKAVPVQNKNVGVQLDEVLMTSTIRHGFVLAPEIFSNYSTAEIESIIKDVESELGLSGKQANSALHKSWAKVRDASMFQLVIEQLVHYFTTYGAEAYGIYDENNVYIPAEVLEVPAMSDRVVLTLIKGYTKAELKQKIADMLESGIALAEDTITAVLDVCKFVGFNDADVARIKNKEVKIALYSVLGIVPENPVEFLRAVLYKITKSTLLIKSRDVIDLIKSKSYYDAVTMFDKYEQKHGLENLAEIFYRFKPLFLAFKKTAPLAPVINKIRRLAYEHHVPMCEDFLNCVTAKIGTFSLMQLNDELAKVNTFRKIRLAYALKYRTTDADTILYRIRNGKGYAAGFAAKNAAEVDEILGHVLESIVADLSRNVEGKTIFIPNNIEYALPATEKQFTGVFPSGTCVKLSSDMVFGVYWNNVNHYRVDLDLSLIDANRKFGWDGSYRSGDRTVLFSGDVTDASRGASELFYVKKQFNAAYLVNLNYFNFSPTHPVPFKIFVAEEQISKMRQNYMVDPNHIVASAKTKIDKHQMILGLVTVDREGSKFYFAETAVGTGRSARTGGHVEQSRKYLFNYYTNSINLNELLTFAGALIVDDAEAECDISLAPQQLEKDTIIKLLS